MNGYLRQSTASQSRLIGPFVDDTDFKTAETGLTIANTDIKLRANGTTLSNKNSGGGTHQVNGMYSLTFDATDTANVGELAFSVVVAGALPVFGTFTILEEAVYDALFAASALGHVADQPVNATKIGGTTQTGRDIGASVLLSPGTGAGQLDFTSGVVKANLAQILGTALTETAGQIAAAFKKFFDKAAPTGTINSIPDAVAGAASGLALVGSNVGTATSVSGSVGSVTAGVTVTTNNDKTGYGLSATAVQAVWDALTSALTTTGSIGKWLVDKLDVVLSTRLASASYTAPLDAAGTRSAVGLATANLDAQLTAIDDFLDTEVAAIKAKTDQLTFTGANKVDANVVDWKGATAPAMTGDAYARLGAPFGVSVSGDIASVQADILAVKVRTDALPDDPADASDVAGGFTAINTTLGVISSAIDTTIADSLTAIQSKTTNLPVDPAASSDIPSVDDIAVSVWNKTGTVGFPFPTAGILDNADRADEGPPPSANWTTGVGFIADAVVGHQVASTRIRRDSGVNEAESYWNAEQYANPEFYMTIASTGIGIGVTALILGARLNDIGSATLNGYYAKFIHNGEAQIWKVEAGSHTMLGNVAANLPLATGSKWGIGVVGSVIRAWANSGSSWQLLLEITDTTFTAPGYVGFQTVSSSSASFDDIGGGEAVSPGGAIADAVWDEEIVAGHTDTDTAGKKLSQALILYEGS